MIGQTIGKYRIVELLGRGGMAEVYKAYQASLDRHVAIKLMHAFLADDADFISRFEREAKNVAALRHPNIIQVFDFDVHQDTPYMVMEYVEGGTLKAYLESLAIRHESLPTAEALRIIREVARALAYAHRRNMMHRDVKPANVMLDPSGRVILTDFGIAKILTGPSYTATGATIGTPSYMSPEQGMGRPGDHRSDVYSLGVMLHQLATGQLPFEADTPLAVMLRHVNDPLPLPRSIKPDLQEGVERIILKSMAKSPDDRFQSADEMLANLENLDAATLLAIPPASMASGAAAQLPTMAAPGGAAPATATSIAAGPATQITPTQGVTRLSQAAGTAATSDTIAAEQARPTRRVSPVFAVALGLVLLLGLGGLGFIFTSTGGFGLLNPAAATATPTITAAPSLSPTFTEPAATATIAATGTPDLAATADRATLEALVQALATATPSNTPDLTQTAQACAYNYELKEQAPPDGQRLFVNAKTTKVITLTNSGTCTFPAGTVLSETTTTGSNAPATIDVPAVEPGASAQVSFEWVGPRQSGPQTRAFELRLPDGRVLGQLTFSFTYVVPATVAPTATRTNTPASVKPTPAVSGVTDVYPAGYVGCVYQGENAMDYSCTARLGISGGRGPFTVYVDQQRIGFFQPGEPISYFIVSRRCFPRIYNIRVVDDGTNTQVSRDHSFLPEQHPGLFPGGGCTLP